MYGTSFTAYDAVGSRWRGERSWNATNKVLVAALPFGFGLLSQAASPSATAAASTQPSARRRSGMGVVVPAVVIAGVAVLPADQHIAPVHQQRDARADRQRQL